MTYPLTNNDGLTWKQLQVVTRARSTPGYHVIIPGPEEVRHGANEPTTEITLYKGLIPDTTFTYGMWTKHRDQDRCALYIHDVARTSNYLGLVIEADETVNLHLEGSSVQLTKKPNLATPGIIGKKYPPGFHVFEVMSYAGNKHMITLDGENVLKDPYQHDYTSWRFAQMQGKYRNACQSVQEYHHTYGPKGKDAMPPTPWSPGVYLYSLDIGSVVIWVGARKDKSVTQCPVKRRDKVKTEEVCRLKAKDSMSVYFRVLRYGYVCYDEQNPSEVARSDQYFEAKSGTQVYVDDFIATSATFVSSTY